MTSSLSDFSKTIPLIALGTTCIFLANNYLAAKLITNFLLTEPDEQLTSKVNGFANKLGIDQNFIIRKIPDESIKDRTLIDMCLWSGIETPTIAISSTANDFTIAHELAHIKKKHVIKTSPIGIGIWTTTIAVFLATRNVFGFYTIGSLFTAYLLKQALEISISVPHRRKQEDEADAMAAKVIEPDDLAVAVQMFNAVNSEQELQEKHYAQKKSVLSQVWNKWSIAKDPHPAHHVRRNKIFGIYLRTASIYPIKVCTEAGTLLDCSENQAQILKEMIYASSRKYNLLNFDRMVVKPNSQDANITLYVRKANNEDVAKWNYEVSAEKVRQLINNPDFTLVQSVLKDILDSPMLSNFICTGSIENKEAALKKFKETFPFYNWDNAIITPHSENEFSISVGEKIEPDHS